MLLPVKKRRCSLCFWPPTVKKSYCQAEEVKKRASGVIQRTGEPVGCKEGNILCLCSKAAWMLRKCGTWCVNVSNSEHQGKKPNSWNYRTILAKTKWIKNELRPQVEKRNPSTRGGALDQPPSRIEVKILKCFCAGGWAGLGEYKIDLAWQSWHLSHWPTTSHQSCSHTVLRTHSQDTACRGNTSQVALWSKSCKFWSCIT